MQPALIDPYGRHITYLRLSVTDRCNLRCTYCMGESIRFLPKSKLLTLEEIVRVVQICAQLGIRKVRITGGEPFMRNEILAILCALRSVEGINEVHITTNGVRITEYIRALEELGIASVNLSLDTFGAEQFATLTRRPVFGTVMQAFEALLASSIPLNVNAVLTHHHTADDIYAMCEQTRDNPLCLRFIEEMPFNGNIRESPAAPYWTHTKILSTMRDRYPQLQELGRSHHAATAELYKVPVYQGTLGIIAGFSRTFCHACNRLRITAQGMLKTCLYDSGAVNLRMLLRSGASDSDISSALISAVRQRFRNGFEAEQASQRASGFETMSTIGG
ncbi:MAG: GTP 3',8-cyclase MoaA [Candidatus Kapabacteria bacterium]|nr:GTP 3',8-cyclase MoaA [Candidatus Kapabacteria bacterium]